MNLHDFFDKNKEKIDVFEPKQGHSERFLIKLKENQKPTHKKLFSFKTRLIAASVLLLFGGYLTLMQLNNHQKPVEIIPAEQYFSGLIKTELENLKPYETKETEKVYNDAMQQIKMLENEYSKLIKAYQINKDKSILNAMIENFQRRIDVLQFLKKQINEINKSRNYEKQRA
jgi:hypothetical protein